MRNLPVFLLAALVLMTGVSSAQASDKLYLYTENFPPYNMSATGRAFEHNGTNIDGLCTEMVKAILNNRALSKRNHGIFCTTYTESRAPRFKWVGPLTRNLWTIFAPAGTNLQIDNLEDARGLRFGGYRNDVMTEYLLERGYEVSTLDSDDLNPKRLELGQIDLWIADRLAGPYFASQQNVEGLDPVYSFNDTELFLAINLDTPDATVEKLNAGLRKVHETGMFEAIETKYGL